MHEDLEHLDHWVEGIVLGLLWVAGGVFVWNLVAWYIVAGAWLLDGGWIVVAAACLCVMAGAAGVLLFERWRLR